MLIHALVFSSKIWLYILFRKFFITNMKYSNNKVSTLCEFTFRFRYLQLFQFCETYLLYTDICIDRFL